MPDLVAIMNRLKSEVQNHMGDFAHPENRDHYYRVIRIPKRSGGIRTLHEPVDWLKNIQADLARLLSHFDTCGHSLAYKVRGRGGGMIPQAVSNFIGNTTAVLKVDIRNFFPSITPTLVAKMLICNRAVAGYLQTAGLAIPVTDIVTLTTGLPQGAPTSPVISNLVMRDFDHKMIKYCRNRGLRYIRYADDIIFASLIAHRAARKIQLLAALRFIRQQLYHKGMEINSKKTRIMDKSSISVHILGMVCNERVGLGNRKRKQLRGWANRLAFNATDEEFHQNIGRFFGYMAYFYHCDAIGYNKLRDHFIVPIGEKYRRIFSTNRVPWPSTREERVRRNMENNERTRRIITERLRSTVQVQDDMPFGI